MWILNFKFYCCVLPLRQKLYNIQSCTMYSRQPYTMYCTICTLYIVHRVYNDTNVCELHPTIFRMEMTGRLWLPPALWARTRTTNQRAWTGKITWLVISTNHGPVFPDSVGSWEVLSIIDHHNPIFLYFYSRFSREATSYTFKCLNFQQTAAVWEKQGGSHEPYGSSILDRMIDVTV